MRLSTLLAAVLVGVYLLVVAGATAALADAAAACSGWPICELRADPQVAIAMAHRVVAGLVGVALAGTVLVGWRRADRRVRVALAAAAVLFPAQVIVGAVVAGGGAGTEVHLVLAAVLFGVLTLALAWRLEAETDADDVASAPSRTDDAVAVGAATTETDGAASAAANGGESLAAPSMADDRWAWLHSRVRAYVTLTKPRLMWLLCLVAAAGMALAAGRGLSLSTVVYTLGGGVLAIGASGTFNHVLERDVDRRMQRTADRPLATDVVSVRNAVTFGLALAAGSLWAFLQVGVLAAALGLVAILFYSVVYTLVLKPNTVQNTVLGGAAGALPALIGWAAVTGDVAVPGVALAAVVFLWTPAHFYNLALAYKDDYARGGFPMLPVVHGEALTRRHILYYLAATLVVAAVLPALATLGWLYAATTAGLGAVFIWAAVRLHRERTDAAALRTFHAANAYLGGVLVAVLLDTMVV